MKERPILFSGPMVRAILAGAKTQTRRLVKPHTGPVSLQRALDGYCPYGKAGDRLWVRETHAKIIGQSGGWIETDYRATYQQGDRLGDTLGIKKRWTPAIHMPRAASRITLEITGVRVERLQDISEADAVAEGAERLALVGSADPIFGHAPALRRDKRGTHRFGYQVLWDSINGAGSWHANPAVWAVEFKQVKA